MILILIFTHDIAIVMIYSHMSKPSFDMW